ncbi:MAG: hypothetical protein AB1752_11925 [Candidatus Zixiibacteriota bacterium]
MPGADDVPAPGVFVETSGNYEYLTEGYYRCQDAELDGIPLTRPTCNDALDAYVVPVALEKAALAGLAVPEWYFSNEYFTPPAVVYGVNPFSRKFAVVRTEADRESAAKQLTWNFKYSMCCQRIEPTTELVEIRMVGGQTERGEYADWAYLVHEAFNLPVASIRLLKTGSLVQLSAIEILPVRTLTKQERRWADELVRRVRG